MSSNPTSTFATFSDSPRNVNRYLGQDYRFAPCYLRNRDPFSPQSSSTDTRAKENQGKYPLGSFWVNVLNGNTWVLVSLQAGVTNNLANWVLFSNGSSGPLLEFTGGAGTAGTFPVLPAGDGHIELTSTAGTITITGGTNSLNFDLTGGTLAIDTINVDAATPPGTDPVLPDAAGQVTITGGQVATGTIGANVIRTDSLAANTFTIEIQRSTSAASTNAAVNGVSHYNSAQFTVDANAFVSITNFSPFNYVQIDNGDSPYTATATDYYISCDSSGGVITVRLPDAPTQFRMFTIKDRVGSASTNNITVTTVGGVVLIEGATSYLMAGNFDAINLLFNGTSYEVY